MTKPNGRLTSYAVAITVALGVLLGSVAASTAGHANSGPTNDPLYYNTPRFTTPSGGWFICIANSAVGAEPLGLAGGRCEAPNNEAFPVAVAVTSQVTLFAWIGDGWSAIASGQASGTISAIAEAQACAGHTFYKAEGVHTFSYNGQQHQGTTRSTTHWFACAGTPPPKPCDPNSGTDLVTITDIVAIFGPGFDTQTVRDGLPSLNTKMRSAHIDNPRRCAAFLATLRHESRLAYNAGQEGTSSKYRGRGFIQLTGKANYKAAGTHLGHDFVTNPSDTSTTAWSAAVATWYWTVARPSSNTAADNLDMGLISRYIGYSKRLNPAEDLERCNDFRTALQYFSGSAVPDGVVCLRH